jgi:hypothetical protein
MLACRLYSASRTRCAYWDPTEIPLKNSSKVLSAGEVAQKANKIAEVKLLPEWKWGLKPYDRGNQIG